MFHPQTVYFLLGQKRQIVRISNPLSDKASSLQVVLLRGEAEWEHLFIPFNFILICKLIVRAAVLNANEMHDFQAFLHSAERLIYRRKHLKWTCDDQ